MTLVRFLIAYALLAVLLGVLGMALMSALDRALPQTLVDKALVSKAAFVGGPSKPTVAADWPICVTSKPPPLTAPPPPDGIVHRSKDGGIA